MKTVTFRGVELEVVPVTERQRVLVHTALRKGLLPHLGPLNVQLSSRCSSFQVYDAEGNGSLLAAACSENSQWIDVVFWLNRFTVVPVE